MAEDAYNKLLKIFPEHPDANYDLGYVYREKGLYDKAIAQYRKSVEIDPKHPHAHYDIGYIYRMMGQYEKALEAYKKAVEVNPKNPHAHYDIGYIYRMMGQYEKALEEYNKALEIDPKHPHAHYDIGLIYEKWGMKDKAEEEFGIACKYAKVPKPTGCKQGKFRDFMGITSFNILTYIAVNFFLFKKKHYLPFIDRLIGAFVLGLQNIYRDALRGIV